MGIRPKIFLIFFACGVAPVLLLIYISNLNSVEAVEAVLRADVERDAAAIARTVEARQREQEASLLALARSPSLRAYVQQGAKQAVTRTQAPPLVSFTARSAVETVVPDDVRADVGAFLRNRYYAAVTCLSFKRQVLFRVEPDAQVREDSSLLFQTRDFLSNGNADERVWSAAERVPTLLLRAPLASEPAGMIMRYTVPIFTAKEGGGAEQRGALVADMKVDALFIESASGFADAAGANVRPPEAELAPRIIVVLDAKGNIVYHSNDVLRYQPVSSAMPWFKAIADRMLASDGDGGDGGSGWAFYDSTGSRWLAVYRPIAPLDSSLAVAGNYSLAVGSLRRRGLLNLALAVLVGVLTAIVLSIVAGRTARSIERVTEGAVAIAGGRFDQRIDVRSSDETSLLAQSFNIMTDRLRQQMAREAETRQFEAFLRLSAMMTHDLKNAIAALSLIVRNIERQFHREEFRADAMQSLTLATDKLRALVARLSGPVESLSGEFKRPRPTDLIQIIQRVLAATVIPPDSIQLETELPTTLVATVDAERMERVVENLVLNALEAMGTQSGKLTIEAGRADDGKIFFSVADTGPGMSEAFLRDRLFQAFATTKTKGVGLGLYTCREVVRAHGGQIEVESREGSGTCFRVVLPSASDRAT